MDWTLDMTAGAELLAETLCDIDKVSCGDLFEALVTGRRQGPDQPTPPSDYEDY